MKIAILGASGFAGSEIVKEALAHGHQVLGISRKVEKLAEKIPAHPNLKAVRADLHQSSELALAIAGADVLIHSVHFMQSDLPAILAAAKREMIKRLLVVGGAGSLKVGPTDLIDTPDFPAAYQAEASAGRNFLIHLKSQNAVNWTYLSPSAEFFAGPRTKNFRLGKDDLLVDADGKSRISSSDFAIAMIDEVEKNAHPNQRFTVGY